MADNYDKLKKAFPEDELIEDTCYYTNKGKVYVNSLFLQKYFDVSPRQISNYRKDGLDHLEKSPHGLFMYDLNFALRWHIKNINPLQSLSGKKVKQN